MGMMRMQRRWTCADCRREWVFSVGSNECCPACGSAKVAQVYFMGDFDSTTTPQEIAAASTQAPVPAAAPEPERLTPMTLVHGGRL
jgi:hypothetical protein